MQLSRCALVILASLALGAPAWGGLVVEGDGDTRTFDPSGFPAEIQPKYRLLETKCVKCHSLARLVDAVTTGVAPISKSPFDKKAAKRYGIKMMRKPSSGIGKADAKAIVGAMYYLLEEARR